MNKIVFTKSYTKRVKLFIKKHPKLISQYTKTIKLLEVNPYHPSLRLHKLSGKMSELYSVSINMSYRISLDFIIENKEIILVNIGKHDDLY